MTRRPASRRPPKLDLIESEREIDVREPRTLTPRDRLKKAGVTGCPHPRIGRDEARFIAQRVAADDPRYTYGLELGDVEIGEVLRAFALEWGCDLGDARARIDVGRTVDAFHHACQRLAAVARAGERVIFATARPASLLGVHTALAGRARAAGATVLTIEREGPVRARGRSDRSLFWIDGVAVLSDGSDLLAHDEADLWRDIDFAVGRAELVVTDGPLGGGALAAGFEVVALADLPLVALGVAAGRGASITVVPLVTERSPARYGPLIEMADVHFS